MFVCTLYSAVWFRLFSLLHCKKMNFEKTLTVTEAVAEKIELLRKRTFDLCPYVQIADFFMCIFDSVGTVGRERKVLLPTFYCHTIPKSL